MKIGLYGGIANNMYVLSKALVQAGYDVMFVRDVRDHYPFSQPLWEDIPLTIPYEEISTTTHFSREYWLEKEQQLGWIPPMYVKTPAAWENSLGNDFFSLCTRAYSRIFLPYLRETRGLLSSNDLVIVCGTDGEILASKLGLPYIIWPHGADICLAAGIGDPPRGVWSRLSLFSLRSQLKRAFVNANYVGSHDAKGIGGHLADMTPFLSRIKFGWLPIPIQKRQRDGRDKRLSRLKDLLSTLQDEYIANMISPNELICFIPSRVDFFWKGQDRLLRALAGKPLAVRLIFAGWGQDYEKCKSMVKELGLESRVIFLPVAVSKPILFDLFDSVDLVIDQFLFGSYGTSAIEAMASGVPVMMSIDEEAYRKRGWLPPPVINVETEQEIERSFYKIFDGAIDLDQCSQATSEWFDRTHAYRSFFEYANPLFERIVREHLR